ncbi:MAG: hypothetical protein ACREQI_02015 [Candidatus Binataceae bacterium]
MNLAKIAANAILAGLIAAIPVAARAGSHLKVRVHPRALSFKKLHAGVTSPAKVVTLSNRGASAIQIWSIAANGQFTSANDCGSSIAPGASCRIWVQFVPAMARKIAGSQEKGKLIVSYSAPGDAQPVERRVALAGETFGTASIYVANFGSASVNEYPFGATGDVSPTTIISGPGTGLANPFGVALDSTGNIYVANLNGGNSSPPGSVTVYPPGSSGDAAPLAAISGAATGLNYPWGIALDSSGNIYVANIGPCCAPECGESITIYASGSNGNAAPIGIIPADATTQINGTYGIVFDAAGRLWAANYGGGPSAIGSITAYAPGAWGDVAPVVNITGDTAGDSNAGLNGPAAVSLDPGGNIYVTNGLGANVTVYSAGSNGNVSPAMTIGGSNTGFSVSEMNIALDYTGNFYVTNSQFGYDLAPPPLDLAEIISEAEGSPWWDDTTQGNILIFPPKSDGNAAPAASLDGSNTALFQPWGYAIGPSAP